ncbi:hypothetical protein IFM89_001943 [Coptis chinensis]|uniref:Glycosyl transferase CAP10 domain-containing protein n=1 Tax=Coptis chinensis TaxID=261450 RepID=A0A835IVF5_9MAGN|nr:hypothetical protein IFM89_001943 [Coptis chinensis]
MERLLIFYPRVSIDRDSPFRRFIGVWHLRDPKLMESTTLILKSKATLPYYKIANNANLSEFSDPDSCVIFGAWDVSLVLVQILMPEININPWEFLLEKLKEGNDKVKWTEREPYAYWKENPRVLKTRQDLLKCKTTDKVDWNACLYAQVEEMSRKTQLADGFPRCVVGRILHICGLLVEICLKARQ